MKNWAEDIRKPSSFNRHTEAWKCKFRCYSVGELTQSLPFGALQYTNHHTRSSVKKTGLSFFPLGDSSKHFLITASINACENRKSQSCFYLTVASITSQMKLASKSDAENLCTRSVSILPPGRSCLTHALPVVGEPCGYNKHLNIHFLTKDKGLTPQHSFHPPQLSNRRCRNGLSKSLALNRRVYLKHYSCL